MRSRPVGAGSATPAREAPSAVAFRRVPSAARTFARCGGSPARVRTASPLRSPGRRSCGLPVHARRVAAARDREHDAAAQRAEDAQRDDRAETDAPVSLLADDARADGLHARGVLGAPVVGRELGLGRGGPCRGAERAPHRGVVEPLPGLDEAQGRGAAVVARLHLRAPVQPAGDEPGDHERREDPPPGHPAAGPAAESRPAAPPPPASPATAAGHEHRARPACAPACHRLVVRARGAPVDGWSEPVRPGRARGRPPGPPAA